MREIAGDDAEVTGYGPNLPPPPPPPPIEYWHDEPSRFGLVLVVIVLLSIAAVVLAGLVFSGGCP